MESALEDERLILNGFPARPHPLDAPQIGCQCGKLAMSLRVERLPEPFIQLVEFETALHHRLLESLYDPLAVGVGGTLFGPGGCFGELCCHGHERRPDRYPAAPGKSPEQTLIRPLRGPLQGVGPNPDERTGPNEQTGPEL